MSEENTAIPMLQTYRTISLYNSKNIGFEITSNVGELNVYEDIFSNVLSGNALIVDDNGGLSEMMFNGNEKLTMELYKSADSDEVTSHDFFVYKISDNTRIKDGTSAYILHFSSIEVEISKNTRCYSSYEGLNSEAINKIFKLLSSNKALEIEETIGTHKFVMPSITPLEAINWYSGRSISTESNGSYFLFFETMRDGFKFKCVDTLAGAAPVTKYAYEPAGNTFLNKNVLNIKEYEVIQTADTLVGLDENYSTLWNADSIRKKIVKEKFDFDKDKKSTLNKGDSFSSSNEKNGFEEDMKERRESFGTKPVIRNEDRNTHTQSKDYYYGALQPKLSAIRQFNALKLRFLVFGNRKIQTGDVIELNFMKTRMFDAESKGESKDDVLSGRYLITAIRYIYKINNFDMSIEVVKDTRE